MLSALLLLGPVAVPGAEVMTCAALDGAHTTAGNGTLAVRGSLNSEAESSTSGNLLLQGGTGPISGLVEPPILPTISGTVESPLNRELTAPWSDAGTWSATGLPAGISMDGTALTGTPTAAGAVTTLLRYTTTAGLFTEKSVVFQIGAAATGSALLTVPDATTGGTRLATLADLTVRLATGSTFSYRIPAPTDAEITYTGLPAWAADTGRGIISGTASVAGSTIITATVTSASGQTVTTTLTLQVVDAVVGTHGLLVLQPATTRLQVGQGLVTPLTIIGDATGVVFTATGLPPGMTCDPTTGAITGTPTLAGSYLVRITATEPGVSPSRAVGDTVLASTSVVITVLPKTLVDTDGGVATNLADHAPIPGDGSGCGLGAGLGLLTALMFGLRRRGGPS